MKILLFAATPLEIAPTVDWLAGRHLASEVTVIYTGVGVLTSTHRLASHFASQAHPDLAIQGGIAGAIDRGLALGSAVNVTSECLLDAGAEGADGGLITQQQLGFPDAAPFNEFGILIPRAPLLSLGLPEVAGGTVSMATGSETSLMRIKDKFPDVGVESMEGAPFFYSCMHAGVPCLQLRGLSNYVGERDRDGWKIPAAVTALNTALQRLLITLSSSPSR